MLIDCDTCVARDIACDECVVAVLLRSRPQRADARSADREPIELDIDERAAIGSLAYVGLVPPLRMLPASHPGHQSGPQAPDAGRNRGIA